MNRRVSAAIGMVGGVVDIVAGFAYLQQSSLMRIQPMMLPSPASWIGYFLLILGVIVFLSGAYLLSARMMRNRALFGWLMIVYGVIMLLLGVGMIGQMFSMMMEASTVSGAVMIAVGIAMLYSGYDMARM